MNRKEYLAEVDRRTAAIPDLSAKLEYLASLRRQWDHMERRLDAAASRDEDLPAGAPDAWDIAIIDGELATRASEIIDNLQIGAWKQERDALAAENNPGNERRIVEFEGMMAAKLGAMAL